MLVKLGRLVNVNKIQMKRLTLVLRNTQEYSRLEQERVEDIRQGLKPLVLEDIRQRTNFFSTQNNKI